METETIQTLNKMIFSRHIYWTILLRILLILATSGTGLWLIISPFP